MPSLKQSAVQLDEARYRRMQPDAQRPVIQHAPVANPNLMRSTVMISSLPSISTDVDGITRQFYGVRNLPSRRILPT